jgi:hypothetical protein
LPPVACAPRCFEEALLLPSPLDEFESLFEEPELEERLDIASWKRLVCRKMSRGIRLVPVRSSSFMKKASRFMCVHRVLREPTPSIMTATLAASAITASIPRDIRQSYEQKVSIKEK